MRTRLMLLTFSVLISSIDTHAEFNLRCYLKDNCNGNWRSTSTNPSTGSQVKINPSAVPTEAGFGIEGLLYKNEVDLSLVRGTGRVGAAISPSNNEETFFGPPGLENVQDYFERKQESEKYPNQKFTLSVAMNLLNKNGTGLNNYSLKLGAMAKYNKLTTTVSPGAGLTGTLGFLSFGGSVYNDETQLEDPLLPSPNNKFKITYQVQTYNVGLFLSSLILDYSHLELKEKDKSDVSAVKLLTASLLVKDFILTAGQRQEDSGRPYYNYETKQLETLRIKSDVFAGAQYRFNEHLMMGLFYNYYLLHEGSLAATVFF